MAFRRGGAGRRRDSVEPSMVAALRRCGALVWQIGGKGLPDLLVRYKGAWHVFEVKTGKGRMTQAQVNGAGQAVFPVVRDVDEVLVAIGALK